MYDIESIYNVGDLTPTTIDKIVERLASKEMLGKIMPIRAANSKEERESLKRGLPAFSLCKFNGRADSKNFISTRYIIYDVDDMTKFKTDQAIKKVEPFSLFSFISPSGHGLKFVIEMDKDMTLPEYRYNRRHYRGILSQETGLTLDDSYNSYHTFYGYYGKTAINENAHIFKTITPEIATRNDDVNIETVDSGEFSDIANYLANKKLNYFEWTTVAFALQRVKDGEELFKIITEGDKHPDHSHRSWEKKWRECQNPTDITLGSFYHIAHQHGYIRKEKYVEEGRGKYLPFVIKPNGMYWKPKDKPAIRIFGFTSIKIQYTVFDPIRGNEICLLVNGTELMIKAVHLSSASEFRKVILSTARCNPYMITSSRHVSLYDMLFNYLDMTKNKTIVESLHGMGKVADGVWNFGSVVIANEKVLPYDPMLTWGDKGYALDDISSKIQIFDHPHLLIRKLNLMHTTYVEYAATAIGWAVANVFYEEIMTEFAAFPILFLFGKTASGKTKLATVILSMFGIKNPEKTGDFRMSLTSATQTAMARVKHGTVGIPHFFDEYRGTRKDHYEMLKNFYEGAGRAMARKTNDAQIHRMEIGSGSIFASVEKDNEPEAVNRCVYIDTNHLKPDDPGAEMAFQKEFMSEQGLKELSAFILHIVCEKNWIEFLTEYRRMRKYIEQALWEDGDIVDSRIQVNYALVAAGYSICKKLFKKPVSDLWWVLQVKEAASYSEDTDPVNRFLGFVYGFAIEGKNRGSVFTDPTDNDDEIILSFNVGIALKEVRLVDRLLDNTIAINATELGKRLRAHPDYIGDSTKIVHFGDETKKVRVARMRYRI